MAAVTIAFVGPPGAGKTVQANRLAEEHGMLTISTGEALRAFAEGDTPEALETRELLLEGNHASPTVVKRVMTAWFDSCGADASILLDGYPRSVVQGQQFGEVLASAHREVTALVVFDLPAEEVLRRLSLRGRSDDTLEGIERRQHVYQEATQPLVGWAKSVGWPVLEISGLGTPEEVSARILDGLGIDVARKAAPHLGGQVVS